MMLLENGGWKITAIHRSDLYAALQRHLAQAFGICGVASFIGAGWIWMLLQFSKLLICDEVRSLICVDFINTYGILHL